MSNFKSPHFNNLSEAYDNEPLKFMLTQRKPNTIFLRQRGRNKKGELMYAVDGDSGFVEASNVVLLKMGKYMEKMFTTDSKFFDDHYVLDLESHKPKVEITPEMSSEFTEEDYYRYMRAGKMFLRS